MRFPWSQCTLQITNRCTVNSSRQRATSPLLVVCSAASILWQGKHSLEQPQSLFFSHSVPSLLLHHVLVDYESGPEAAVPAWLQWWTEPDCEKLGHWHSLRQLRVLCLRLQQFQLSRLQLSLRIGAGTSSDMTVHLTKPRTHSGSHQLWHTPFVLFCFFCFQEKSLPGVVMALVCNVFEMLYQLANLDESRYTYTLLTATKKELHIYQWFMVSFIMSI